MKLSKIVDAVNAKSFGETNWTYSDIYPYFQEAIADVNGEIEPFRYLANAPLVSESDEDYDNLGYDMLSDTHILNYVVTYIVVAMDNAQLATTSRTQSYASQLTKYKRQLIADLYKWMPLRQQSNNFFDFEPSRHVTEIPNPGKVWYDESYGKCSSRTIEGNKQKVPTIGVRAENPYGHLIPKNANEEIQEGLHKYIYIFIPFDTFIDYYRPVEVEVTIRGYDIDTQLNYNSITDVNEVVLPIDAELGSRQDLFRAVWSVMKSSSKTPKSVSGAYVSGGKTYSYIFTQYGDRIIAYGDNSIYTITNENGAYNTSSMLSAISVDENTETLIIGYQED